MMMNEKQEFFKHDSGSIFTVEWELIRFIIKEVFLLLADQFDAFFLDLDGVVYIGRKALPGTLPTLQRLRTMGKHIRFLTNNPCKTRERLVERLRNMGIEAHKEDMFTANWTT